MKKKVAASELMARLNANPDYVARKKEQDEAFQRREQEYARAETPLVEELRAAGVNVGSVWDLVNTANTYPQSLPILLNHLHRAYPDAIRDGIARALAVPSAKFAWSVLVKLFRQEQGKRTKDGLAVAISNIADDGVIDELIALARDVEHGESRLLLLSALERSQLPRARKALMELGVDPQLQKEVQIILRRVKSGRTGRARGSSGPGRR